MKIDKSISNIGCSVGIAAPELVETAASGVGARAFNGSARPASSPRAVVDRGQSTLPVNESGPSVGLFPSNRMVDKLLPRNAV